MENLKFKTEQTNTGESNDWRSLRAEAPSRVNELIREINPNFDQLPTVERVVILRELLNTYNISDRESRPANFNQYRYIVPIIASRLKFEEERAKAEMFTSSLSKSWN